MKVLVLAASLCLAPLGLAADTGKGGVALPTVEMGFAKKNPHMGGKPQISPGAVAGIKPASPCPGKKICWGDVQNPTAGSLKPETLGTPGKPVLRDGGPVTAEELKDLRRHVTPQRGAENRSSTGGLSGNRMSGLKQPL